MTASPAPLDSNRGLWIAFLLCCFLLTGMVGLFASYGPDIPLERALHRIEVLDAALAASPPDAASLRTALGPAGADAVLTGPEEPAARAARARAGIIAEAREDEAGVGARTRLMIYTVTLLSAAIGTGILLIVSRARR